MKKGTGGRLLIREIYRRVQHTIFSGPLARYKRCLLLLTSIQWKSSLSRGGAGEVRAESKGHRPQDIRYSDSILRIHRRRQATMARTQRLFCIEPLTILSQKYRVSHRYGHTQTPIINISRQYFSLLYLLWQLSVSYFDHIEIFTNVESQNWHNQLNILLLLNHFYISIFFLFFPRKSRT